LSLAGSLSPPFDPIGPGPEASGQRAYSTLRMGTTVDQLARANPAERHFHPRVSELAGAFRHRPYSTERKRKREIEREREKTPSLWQRTLLQTGTALLARRN